MADTKISAMTSATTVANADVVPIVQGGANKKATKAKLLTADSGEAITLAGNASAVVTINASGEPTIQAASGQVLWLKGNTAFLVIDDSGAIGMSCASGTALQVNGSASSSLTFTTTGEPTLTAASGKPVSVLSNGGSVVVSSAGAVTATAASGQEAKLTANGGSIKCDGFGNTLMIAASGAGAQMQESTGNGMLLFAVGSAATLQGIGVTIRSVTGFSYPAIGQLVIDSNGEVTLHAATGFANTVEGNGGSVVISSAGAITLTPASGQLVTIDGVAFVCGVSANNLLQLNGSAQIPAVDGSLLTGLTAGQVGITIGVSAGDVIALNGSAQIPAVDGSLLTGLTSTSVGLANVPNVDATLYTPTTSSDWAGTAPTTVLEALDRIAAVLTLNSMSP